MSPDVKAFIENNIALLEAHEFDTFYEKAQQEFKYPQVHELAISLEFAGIHSLDNMTFIPEGYFMYSSAIDDYTVPKNIVRICFKAFYVSDLRVIRTNNVIELDYQAFGHCYMLTDVILDEGMQFIQDCAFEDCEELNNVIIPKSLEGFGHNVFYGCSNLTELRYKGTISEWNKIRNHEFVQEGGSYISKIICSDGIIEL